MAYPKQNDVEIPLLQVLVQRGDSAKPREIYPDGAKHFSELTVEEQETRWEGTPVTRKWWNLVQWVRQHLLEIGQIDGSKRGIWAIAEAGRARLASSQTAHAQGGTNPPLPQNVVLPNLRDLTNKSHDESKAMLLAELKNLSPTGFEHFCMELLGQLGYRNVAVTRRSGDGGIDGYGDFRQGAVSIKSAFQAK